MHLPFPHLTSEQQAFRQGAENRHKHPKLVLLRWIAPRPAAKANENKDTHNPAPPIHPLPKVATAQNRPDRLYTLFSQKRPTHRLFFHQTTPPSLSPHRPSNVDLPRSLVQPARLVVSFTSPLGIFTHEHIIPLGIYIHSPATHPSTTQRTHAYGGPGGALPSKPKACHDDKGR